MADDPRAEAERRMLRALDDLLWSRHIEDRNLMVERVVSVAVAMVEEERQRHGPDPMTERTVRCRCNCHNDIGQNMFPEEHKSCETCLDELLEEATELGRLEQRYLTEHRPASDSDTARADALLGRLEKWRSNYLASGKENTTDVEPAPPQKFDGGCGLCDGSYPHEHPMARCRKCGAVGLTENMNGPFAMHRCEPASGQDGEDDGLRGATATGYDASESRAGAPPPVARAEGISTRHHSDSAPSCKTCGITRVAWAVIVARGGLPPIGLHGVGAPTARGRAAMKCPDAFHDGAKED